MVWLTWADFFSDQRVRKGNILILLCLAALLEGADLVLLGTSFHAIAEEFAIAPKKLAALTLAQSLVLSISSPIWGHVIDRGTMTRRTSLCSGCFGWGLMTILISMCGRFETMVLFRTLNGAMLACVLPVTQSIIADLSDATNRAKFYGTVAASVKFGEVFSIFIALPLSHVWLYGYRGWRLTHLILGILSMLTGAFIWWSLVLPETNREDMGEAQLEARNSSFNARIMKYMKIPTFRVIIIQGCLGSIPWSALTFLPMYLQLSGFTDFETAHIMTLGIAASAFGQIVGGQISDAVESKWPQHGRAISGQLSFFAKPLAIFLLWQNEKLSFGVVAFTLTIFYAIASWCSVGACRPILATISDESDRSSIFGWQVGLEGSFAALFGAPVVGWMSESLFEYNAHKGVVGGDAYRGRALGRAMGWVCLVGWSISFFIFSALHYTVPRDAKTGSDSVPVTEKADPEARLFSPKAEANEGTRLL